MLFRLCYIQLQKNCSRFLYFEPNSGNLIYDSESFNGDSETVDRDSEPDDRDSKHDDRDFKPDDRDFKPDDRDSGTFTCALQNPVCGFRVLTFYS